MIKILQVPKPIGQKILKSLSSIRSLAKETCELKLINFTKFFFNIQYPDNICGIDFSFDEFFLFFWPNVIKLGKIKIYTYAIFDPQLS